MPTKGLFTWREEDPSTRKILEGWEGGITLRWVYMQKFSPWVVQVEKVREGIKNGRWQNQKCNLGPSALFTGVNHYLSAELTQ